MHKRQEAEKLRYKHAGKICLEAKYQPIRMNDDQDIRSTWVAKNLIGLWPFTTVWKLTAVASVAFFCCCWCWIPGSCFDDDGPLHSSAPPLSPSRSSGSYWPSSKTPHPPRWGVPPRTPKLSGPLMKMTPTEWTWKTIGNFQKPFWNFAKLRHKRIQFRY